jgi:hypothetical protein
MSNKIGFCLTSIHDQDEETIMQRRSFAHPETNTESLGGEGRGRDEVKQRVTHNGIRIESDKPPPVADVTRLPGQGREGLRGLFKGTLQNLKEHQQQQRRQRPHGTEAMNKYLQYGGLDSEDR